MICLGVVHKLRWQDFGFFLTTNPPTLTFSMVWTLTKSGHFRTTYLTRYVVCKYSKADNCKESRESRKECINSKSGINQIFYFPPKPYEKISTRILYFFCIFNIIYHFFSILKHFIDVVLNTCHDNPQEFCLDCTQINFDLHFWVYFFSKVYNLWKPHVMICSIHVDCFFLSS